MGMQSFRGAGGVGAISVRPAVPRETTTRYALSPSTQELTSAEGRAHSVLVQASTAAAIVTGALVATWVVYG
jgi:hypothetical protein